MHLYLNASLTKMVLKEIFLTSTKRECKSGEYEDNHSHAKMYWYTILLK